MKRDAESAHSIEAQLVAGLSKVGLALRTAAWDGAHARGLSPTQGQILSFLDRRGSASLRSVAEHLAITPPTASDAVGALVAKTLVRRRRSASDGRTLVLSLTATGRAEAHRAANWSDAVADAVGALSPLDQRQLLGTLIHLVTALQARGEIPLASMCFTCRFFRKDVHPGSMDPHHCAFIDRPLGPGTLRLDCEDHEPTSVAAAAT